MPQLVPVMAKQVEVIGALSVVGPIHMLTNGRVGDIGLISMKIVEGKLSIVDILRWVPYQLSFPV